VAAKELQALLTKPSLDGIPLLVLGNKNDLPGALDTQQLIAQLNLQVCVRVCLRVCVRVCVCVQHGRCTSLVGTLPLWCVCLMPLPLRCRRR
jgi:hypothetical protein